MKKSFILFILILISKLSYGQDLTTLVPNTKYSMIPPKGFILSSNFSGFQNNGTGASIMISDLPASYVELVKSFTKEALKTKGLDLISKQNVKYNNTEAMLYRMSQEANGLKYFKQVLVFGDETKTIMVNGIYPEHSKEQEKEIYNSLFSIKYNEKSEIKPLESSSFSIDVKETDYVLVKSLSGSLLFTEDGKLPSNKGLIIVSNSLGNKVSPDHQKNSIERLNKLPDADKAIIKTIDKIKISNMDGYEIVAEGNNNQLIYQTMLFTLNNEYYLIVGEANDNKEKNLEVFKQVARTFKLK